MTFKVKNIFLITTCLALLFIACNGNGGKGNAKQQEDTVAKQMLQGIWKNADDESVAFKVQGDTIFYPDSTSSPVYFQVMGDTLVMHGASIVKYPILKQAPHLFVFNNQNGETVTLTLSQDPSDKYQFEHKQSQVINQNQLIRRDTVVTHAEMRYHCYVQVNPTSFKVVKTTYNDEGVEVDNIYYDNIVNLTVFSGSKRLFSRDFRKQDFKNVIPANFLSQAILSDMVFRKADQDGVHYQALIGIPDSPSFYAADVIVSPDGKQKISIAL